MLGDRPVVRGLSLYQISLEQSRFPNEESRDLCVCWWWWDKDKIPLPDEHLEAS